MEDDLHITKGELVATDILKSGWSNDKNKVGGGTLALKYRKLMFHYFSTFVCWNN